MGRKSFSDEERRKLYRALMSPVDLYRSFLGHTLCGPNLAPLLRSLQPPIVFEAYKELSRWETPEKSALTAWLTSPLWTGFNIQDTNYCVEVYLCDQWRPEYCGLWNRQQDDSHTWRSRRRTYREWRDAPLLKTNHPWYEEMYKWAVDYEVFEARRKKAEHSVNEITEHVNTPGQWKRIWPESVPHLPEHMKERIANAERASRLPKDMEWLLTCNLVDALALTAECTLAMTDPPKFPERTPKMELQILDPFEETAT